VKTKMEGRGRRRLNTAEHAAGFMVRRAPLRVWHTGWRRRPSSAGGITRQCSLFDGRGFTVCGLCKQDYAPVVFGLLRCLFPGDLAITLPAQWIFTLDTSHYILFAFGYQSEERGRQAFGT
jgi:hypothetical protein